MEHPSCGSENPTDVEMIIVGSEKTTVRKLNQDLNKILGTKLDYCGDDTLSLEALEALGRQVYVKPTLGREWVCIFDHEGKVAITAWRRTEAEAAAVALLFCVQQDKSVVS